MNAQSLRILLVEDDDVDAMAFERHVGRASVPTEVFRAVDGVDGLAKLRELNCESPLLVFLDLNMPRMSGAEFLRELRHDVELRHHIVFVLTTSSAASDLRASYEQNVAGYLLKSDVGNKFQGLIALIESYFGLVTFPPIEGRKA